MNMIAIEIQTKAAARSFSAGSMEHYGREAAVRIEQSVAYMTQHLDRPLQVATLAAKASVSPSHFFALFKRRIGLAPMDYFTRLRMGRACQLLETTSLSVKEVAAELGYEDPFYFSRVFKSVNQLAPSDYRAAQRETAAKNGGDRENLNLFREPITSETPKRVQFA
jgi:transcriptional regulator GlxA family with amidase domain